MAKFTKMIGQPAAPPKGHLMFITYNGDDGHYQYTGDYGVKNGRLIVRPFTFVPSKARDINARIAEAEAACSSSADANSRNESHQSSNDDSTPIDSTPIDSTPIDSTQSEAETSLWDQAWYDAEYVHDIGFGY